SRQGRSGGHRSADVVRRDDASCGSGGASEVKLRFWGARGSFAMSGREFLRYGGNTCSIELVTDAGLRLLVDLGTGATELAKTLMGSEFGKGQGQLPILLTHTHLDHIQGLPFFTPFFIKGNQIQIMGANPTALSLESTL